MKMSFGRAIADESGLVATKLASSIASVPIRTSARDGDWMIGGT